MTKGRHRRPPCCYQHQEECPQDLREEAAPFIREVVEVPTPPGLNPQQGPRPHGLHLRSGTGHRVNHSRTPPPKRVRPTCAAPRLCHHRHLGCQGLPGSSEQRWPLGSRLDLQTMGTPTSPRWPIGSAAASSSTGRCSTSSSAVPAASASL